MLRSGDAASVALSAIRIRMQIAGVELVHEDLHYL